MFLFCVFDKVFKNTLLEQVYTYFSKLYVEAEKKHKKIFIHTRILISNTKY